MKNTSLFRRILSVVLVVAMVLSVMVPSISAEQLTAKTGSSETRELDLVPIDPGTLDSRQHSADKETNEETAYRSTDVVRVSIVLEKASTLDAGFKAESYTRNPAARAYRASLREEQKAMTAKIEQVIGGKLDVKWNLTLAANNISANVLYGQIEAIKAIDGVKDVFLENRYEPQVDEEADEPNNGSASYMIGSNITWANGYTGAGSKVAVIDTGIDSEHQSFSGEALEYALAQTAEEKGMSYDEYVASLNLLTAEKIDAVKGELNAAIGSGAAAYRNTKIAYGYNYVDKRVDYIEHMQDSQGEHGSHVEGISAANRFIKVDGEFVPALQAVGTQGVAPDAQIVVMKVFGIGGGAYDSDYIVAIEDAIVLGCDSANLSLGSGSTGFSFSSGYEDTMNKLVENGTVVAFSAGNSGMWYDTPNNSAMGYPYLYIDDVNYATGGSPGSFTNSLTVASVDNMGQTGRPLVFGDRHVFYSETSGYGNSPIATIAGQEYEYVLVDGPGVDDNDHVGQEGDQFMAIGSEVLTGKIAMCYRGSSSFFAKANAAVAQGAVGVVIINNVDGVINMNLTGYNYTAPAVSILKADGDAIKEASQIAVSENGQEYYTGTMSISGDIEVQVPEVTDTVSVSSFSSYGPGGTLGMKPEILAPGGSIYSVFGANNGSTPQSAHDQYEVMSGTSMASPQVAGMAAVMGQYIRDNDLCAKTGLSQRQLTNSLLMSTAHPVFDADGEYWPTFRVGSGLGNVADATAAKSYILMDENATLFPDTAKDGKVKVELGDDPDCVGEYEYSFTVYPMEGSKSFTLRTDLFTQAVAGNAGYGLLQYTGTMAIGSVATYEVNGEVYEDTYALEADVNMDGETNEADAQAILDKLTGALAEDAAFDEAAADVDGDNAITTVDARLILESAATPVITITEPTKVTVNLKIDEGWKALLLSRYFTKGFFVEGYTYVDPVADEEGVLDVVHSIPILGYCGSWTDPAMLDRSSAIDVAYGTAKQPYVTNSRESNYMSVKDADGDVSTYMGNPYMIEDEFPVERLALNSETTINAFNYLNIRNVATLGFAIQDADGKVLFAQATPTQKYSAYYYVNGGTWQNTTPANYNVGKKLASAGVKEGDVITVGFYALPEYYGVINAKNNGQVAATGSLDTAGLTAIIESGILGDGAGIKYTVTVDNTAPEVKGALMDLITGDITIRAQDNRYVAYVAVMNKSGSKVYMEGVPEQTGPNELVEVPLELPEGVTLPKGEVVLLVADYAGNESAFKVNLGGNGEEEDNGGLMVGFVPAGSTAAPGSGNRAWEIDKDALWYNHGNGTYAGLSNYANVDFTVTAAEYVDGYVFMAADDGNVYAAELGALDEASRVGSAIDAGYVYDMAFNYTNNNLYLLGDDNTVYKMHLITGELTKVAVVTLADNASGKMNRLAIDDNGVFYTANDGNTGSAKLYKFTLDDSAYVPEDPDPGEDPVVPGETTYAWDFESGADGWTLVDADGDGYNWTWNQDAASWWSSEIDLASLAHNSTGCIVSGSYINTVGALTPDNWAISPAIDLSEVSAASVSFYAVSVDPDYPEQITVYAGTSADPAEMVAVSDAITTPAEFAQYTADLSDFVGEEEVYVALRNNGTSDMYLAAIDDVEIVTAAADGNAANQPSRSGKTVGTRSVNPAVVTGEAVYSYSFESEDEFNAWTLVDSDGDSYNWMLRSQGDGGNDWDIKDGEKMIFSASYLGTPLTPDNWIISPAMNFSGLEDATLSVWAVGQDPSYAEEVFALYAGTSNNPAEMTKVSDDFTATGAWTQYTADLADFVGEEAVYVALRHYNVTDMFYLNADLVEILTEGEVPVDPDPEDPDPEDPDDPPATGEDLEPVVAEITAEQVGTAAMGVYNKSTGGSMAWDHDNDLLYLVSNWNATQDYDHYLWTVDTTTGVAAKANSVNSSYSARLYGSVRGLFIVPGNNHLIYPTDIATGMEVEPGELNLFKGQTAEITVTLYPWTLTNKDVTWESADPAIATVKDGVVTGVEEGETVVTVTSAALSELGEPHVIEIPVTVSMPPEAEIRGIIWDENGKGQASVFNSNATQEWTALSEVGQLRWGALVGDTVYGSTEDTMYAFDADTYEVTQLGGIVSMWIPSDACELPEDFVEAFAAMGYNVGSVIGPNNNGTYLTMLDPEAGSLLYFDLGDTVFGSDPMATFTGAGRGVYDDGESTDENGATFYGLTESGELYLFTMNHEGSVMWTDLGNTGLDLSGVADATNSVWASTVYDAENEFLYLSLYNGADEYAHLYAIDVNDLSRVGETGNFNADVWPVTGLYEYEPATDLVLKVKPESLVLFEGETAELNIKVKLGETNEYTVEVADENVCTFADGVVTALKEGETTITVTTVDVNEAGEHLSKEIPVKVKGFKSVDIFVNGQVTDENGARFTKISLDGAVVSKKGVDAPGNVTSGTRAGELYVADIGGSVNILDAVNFEPNLDWNKFDTATYAEYPALDFANYPTYRTTAGLDVDDKVLMTTSVGWLVKPDYYGWNISSFISDMAGVAFGGLEEMEDGTLVYDYYILGADGTLYLMAVDFVNGRRTDPQAIFNTGIVLANPTDASMTFVATAKVNPDGSISEEEYENAGLVIADNGSKKLWYLDFMAEEEDDVVGLVGIMDVENVSGLYGTFDELDSVADIQGIEPFDPGPEPQDPGEYPEPAEGFYNPVVTWDFNDTVDGWTFFDRDADGNNWIWTPEGDYSTIAAYEGAGMILSQSYINDIGALNPDNFAISPAINLADYDNANISFWAKGQDASYAAEVFAVYAGTSAEVGEMVKISDNFTATGSWTQYTASLADFAGEEEVYVAIRHYSCTDMYFLDVDYVEVLTEGGEAPPEPVAPVYEWSFENTTDLDGWTLLSNDSDASTWARYGATGVATPTIPDVGYVLSSTYNSTAAVDDLAITPALDFSELSNATLSFWVMKNSTTWNENYSVYAGTSANFDEMEELVPETAAVNAWTNVTVDLADYAGEEEVYIAFRHTALADQFRIYLDAVEITTIEEEEPTEPFETVLWDFEDEALDAEWTIVDVDGQSSFEIQTTNNAYSGGRALFCYYGDHPNDWAISPAIDLTNAQAPELSVYGRKYGGSSWYEYFQLYAGTSTNVDEMTMVLDTTELAATYSEFVADLSEFAGEPEVYVAIRYCNSPDQFGVYFDDVSVREHTGEDGNAFKHPTAEISCSFVPMKAAAKELNLGFGRLDVARNAGSVEMTKIGETANEVTGGTNAIRGELVRTPVRKPVDETVTENGTVQIVLTEDVAVTNGLFTVTYDAEALSFVDAVSTLPYKSIHHEIVENEGVITIAYASVNEIPAEEVLATLNFTYPEQTVDTTVVVKTLERNDEVAVEEEELEIEVKFDHVHDYGEPEWTWTEDFSAATATFTCECGDVQTVEAVVTTETVDASCTEAGKTVYTAVAVFEETEYTDVQEVEIPATGHTPAEPVIENEVAPTCTEAGSYDEVVYCSVCGEELSRETKTVDAIGHAYGEPEWTWTEENTASAKFVCANCGDEQVIEAVVSSETIEPSCTEAGKTVYTAVATFEDVEYTDTKEIEGDPALGHSYGEPEWTWTEDFTATAKFVCATCGDELVLDAEVSAKYFDTKTVYTGVVTLNETEYTDEVEGPALDPNTYILTDVLKDGDQVVIYNPGYGKGVSNADFSAEQPTYRAGVDVVPEGDKIVNPEDAIVWTVQYVYDEEGNAIGVNFIDAEGRKLSMDAKGLELDKENDLWEIRVRSEEDFTRNIVNVNAQPGNSGDPKALEWYAKYGEFSTHYLNADDSQFIFELYAKVELESECKIGHFVDLEEYPHGTPIHDAIEWAFTHDPQITSGTDETHFTPEKELDRKTAMTFLYAAAGKPEFDVESAEKTFSDVKPGKWYTKAILWAANQDPAITAGNTDGTFGINTVCKTGHMLTFLYAQQGKPEFDESAVPEGYVAEGKWYTAAAKWAYVEGIYRAEGDKFVQSVPCTRATTVLYLYRALTGEALDK
ncbi:MAG: choice-of-anchor J domain-containing protein [Oscillospiraceae bacterium]|nr:choice-of-anchor J domain-containing protein [Oscillospiraceae bacterium]